VPLDRSKAPQGRSRRQAKARAFCRACETQTARRKRREEKEEEKKKIRRKEKKEREEDAMRLSLSEREQIAEIANNTKPNLDLEIHCH